MSKSNNSVLNFIRRNVYYLIIGVALIITAIVIAAVLLTSNSSVAVKPTGTVPASDSVEPTIEPESKSEESDSEKEPESESEDTTHTDTKIVFTMPIAEATVSKNYTSSTVVYNKTLGVYTGHMGIDFSADNGTAVVAAYGGTVESVTTSYLEGTTITIDHGDGLKTVYNSVDAEENIVKGSKVKAGQTIGYVSDNNRQEYKDGPHLHFEVLLDGVKVDPAAYLMYEEK